MNRLAAAISGLSIALVIIGGFAIDRADRALDLWYCHASVGYGHQVQLDECLAGR